MPYGDPLRRPSFPIHTQDRDWPEFHRFTQRRPLGFRFPPAAPEFLIPSLCFLEPPRPDSRRHSSKPERRRHVAGDPDYSTTLQLTDHARSIIRTNHLRLARSADRLQQARLRLLASAERLLDSYAVAASLTYDVGRRRR